MASTQTPLPILLCGKIPSHIEAVREIVKPEMEVIHLASNPSEAKAAVASLLSPSSDSATRPVVVIMGGGFSTEDFESIYNGVEGAKTVPWIRPSLQRPGAGGPPPGGPPPMENVARWAKEVLGEKLDLLRAGGGAGEIWWMGE